MQDASLREAIVRYLIDRGRAAEASPFLQGTASPAAQGLQARVALALGQAANAERVAGSVLAADPGQCDALVALTGIDMALDDHLPLLVFSFHSPSLRPGLTPYVRSEEDLDLFYDWWRGVFAYLAHRGVAPAGVHDIIAAAQV